MNGPRRAAIFDWRRPKLTSSGRIMAIEGIFMVAEEGRRIRVCYVIERERMPRRSEVDDDALKLFS